MAEDVIVIILSFIGAAAFCYVGLPLIFHRIQRLELARRCTREHILVLTYDDGPGPGLTARLLDILRARRVRATFFLTGRSAPDHPELLDRLMLDGHELGCHSLEHHDAWRSWPGVDVRDIRGGYEALSRWIRPDAIFRPPHGRLTLPGLLSLARRRAPIGWWTIDAGDTWRDLPSLQDLVESVQRQRGGVVLMHDFHRDPKRAVHVLSLTVALLDLAEREGWSVRTLSELHAAESDNCESFSHPLPARNRRRAA